MRSWLVGLCLILQPALALAQEAPPAWDTCDECEPAPAWVRLDYLLWWVKPVCLKPPSITTGTADGTPPGALGQPGTTVVLGGSRFEFEGASGLRPAFGFWFTPDHAFGLEVSGFLMEQRAVNQAVTLSGVSGYLPFQNAMNNLQDALPFTIPGEVDGYALGVGRSRLWGTEANLVAAFEAQRGPCTLTATYLFGFRSLDLQESVDLTNVQTLVADPSVMAVGRNLFQTRNQFYGPQIGGRLGIQWNNFEVTSSLQVALGETRQSVAIVGGPLTEGTVVQPGLLPGPIFVLPSNAGRVTTWRLGVVPAADIRFTYRVADALRLSLGYSVIYLNRNDCPGDQMSNLINVTQLPGQGPVMGPLQPKNPFIHTDYFAAGLMAGVELRF